MSNKQSFRDLLQLGIYKIINPFVRFLIKCGLTPNMVTLIGLVLNIGVAIVFITGAEVSNRGDLNYVGWAGALVLFAGLFDMLDGQVARLGGMSSTFGALFDSVLDRYSELILFLGICYYLVAHHYFLSSLFAFIALIGSLMVSYTRARAEGLGVECKGGFMQRPERIVLISLSAIICGVASYFIGGDFKLYIPGISFHVFETITIFTFPIAIMAVLTNITAFRRLMDSKVALDKMDDEKRKKQSGGLNGVIVLLMLLSGSVFYMPNVYASTITETRSGEVNETDTFPVPKDYPGLMFYLQRTPNTNTVMYELNVDAKTGELNQENPIHIYWIRYTEKGHPHKELNYIQRKYAYGLKVKKVTDTHWELKFVSTSKKTLHLQKAYDGKFYVFADINGKRSVLKKLYIKINGGTFWVPNVLYIELKGYDAENGKATIEQLKV